MDYFEQIEFFKKAKKNGIDLIKTPEFVIYDNILEKVLHFLGLREKRFFA